MVQKLSEFSSEKEQKNNADGKDTVFNTIKEFYPFYLGQHANNMCRLLHLIGTSIAMYFIITAIIKLSPIYILFALLIGYGFAWTGHFFFEHNKPATFKYPLFSFACDYILIWHILTGQIQQKLNKYSVKNIKYLPFNFI